MSAKAAKAAKAAHGRYSAMREVTAKSAEAIDRDTAQRWQARALACYRKYVSTGRLAWLLRAEDARHEALEHAAQVDAGTLVRAVDKRIRAVRARLLTATLKPKRKTRKAL